MKSSIQSKLTWGGVICLLGGLLGFIIYQFNCQLWIQTVKLYELLHDPHQLKEIISSFGPYAPLAYIVLQIMQVIFAPIPGAGGVIKFVGGYLFGAKAGFFYSTIALLVGSWFAFGLARIFEKWVVERFVSPKTLIKFDYLISHEGVILSFLLFLIPGFPKDALCYILGLTPMGFGIFLIISTIGRVPGTLIATLQGAKAFDQQYMTLLILFGISVPIILVFYIYHEKIHRWIRKCEVGIQKKQSKSPTFP
jgi:uncharacterized membrane protein YdjX (TVP38/TMEM64 family)